MLQYQAILQLMDEGDTSNPVVEMDVESVGNSIDSFDDDIR